MADFKKTADYSADVSLKAVLESGKVVIVDKQPGKDPSKINVLLMQKRELEGVSFALDALGRKVRGAYRRLAMFHMEADSKLAAMPIGSVLPEITLIRQQVSLGAKSSLRDGKPRMNALPFNGGIAVDAEGRPVYQDLVPAKVGTPDGISLVVGSVPQSTFEELVAKFNSASTVTTDTTVGTKANALVEGEPA